MASNGGPERVDPGFNIDPSVFNSQASELRKSATSQTPTQTDTTTPSSTDTLPPTSIFSSTTSIPSSTSASSTPTTSTTNTLPSATAPPASSDGSKPNNTGVIAGAVCGGVALVIIGGLIAIWLITRDRRKRIKEAHFFSKEPPIPVPPDANNQSISRGDAVVTDSARRDTRQFLEGYGGNQN
ncbi:hypothetical protein AA313_de0208511 [Arthrobotrys entomopaga]|nr:hypothetical protein AA313_de0208511 [Arthrobotrys entomopaga]